MQIQMHVYKYRTNAKKSSNKLRMKALVEWNTLFQVPELINMIVFFTRTKNDMVKGDISIIYL